MISIMRFLPWGVVYTLRCTVSSMPSQNGLTSTSPLARPVIMNRPVPVLNKAVSLSKGESFMSLIQWTQFPPPLYRGFMYGIFQSKRLYSSLFIIIFQLSPLSVLV